LLRFSRYWRFMQ